MNEFLNDFMAKHQRLTTAEASRFQTKFSSTIELANLAFGNRAFRPERPLNAAVYDAVMVGLAKRLETRSTPDVAQLRSRYGSLLTNREFQEAFQRATSDEESVKTRVRLAGEAFADT
jgi:hypothetical protein